MKRLITFAILVLLNTPSHSFEIAFSKEKSSLTKHTDSLSFLDPQTHSVIQTTVLGEMSNLNRASGFADDEEEFFYVLLPSAKRKPWHIVVFSIQDHKEIARLEIGKSNHVNPEFENHIFRFSADSKQLFVIGPDKKKKWRLDVYDKPSHELNWSAELPKGVSGAIVLPTGHLAITTSKQLGGKDSFTVFDVENRKTLVTHEFERGTNLRVLPSSSVDRFILLSTIKTPVGRVKDTNQFIYSDAVSLYTMDAHTGGQIEKVKLGYEPTLVYLDEENDYGYFSTRRSIKGKGLTLWRIKDGEVELVLETDLHYNPSVTFVKESQGLATLLCEKRAVTFRLEDKSLMHDYKLPITAVSGFMSDNGELIYFREEKGSAIGVLDVAKGELIGSSPTGNRGEKFARVLANVATVAIGAYTGIYGIMLPIATETSMMTDKNEESLYVINHVTKDVTIFKTAGLERLDTVSVSSAFAVAHYESSQYIYALGFGEITLIDPQTNKVFKNYEDGAFAGINEVLGNAYYSDEDGLKIIAIATGEVTDVVAKPENIYLVIGSSKKS